jgi:glutamine synthetase
MTALDHVAMNGGAPFSPPATAEEAREYIRANGIEFLFAQFVDMHGKPNAKLVPATHFEDLLTDGAGFAGFAAGDIGQTPNSPDMAAMPDVRTLTPLPFRPSVARFACDVHVEGEEWPYCPRTILRRQLDRAKALGYEFKIGCELEYFLVRKKEDGSIELADPLDTLDQPCYDMRALTRSLDFVSQVARNITSLGWDNYATDHEDANGQFEQNFEYADALTTADRAIFFRYMVESMAQERGLIATFMPKPFAHLTGNGCHFHMSLWKDGENVFEADPADDPNGMGLSPTAYNFIGGLKAHAKAYIAVTAPTVTSYKRLVTSTTLSGSTWAPVYISYGYNNRTQMLRIPGAGRIEDRTVDGSCNPYLAATVILAAGLDGIEKGLDAGDPTTELNLHELSQRELDDLGVEMLPATLLDAARELEKDDVLRAALGNTGSEDYIDYFAKIKKAEFKQAHEQITQWELDRYLQLF